MTEHEHRPTARSYTNRYARTKCRHCGKPLKCVNPWIEWLTMVPVLCFFIFVLIPTGMNMKEALPIWLVLFLLTALLQHFAFRFLKFEVDIVAEYEDNHQDFLRRKH